MILLTRYHGQLFDAKLLLDNLNIPFYVCTGTALGFVRENGFIKHDYDIDVAVKSTDFRPEIMDVFCNSGKFIKTAFRSINDFYVELSFRHISSGIRIDIFLTFEDGENLFNVLWDFHGKYGQGGGNAILMYYPPYEIGAIEYKGVTFNCPGEDYLVQSYGENWKTPIDFKKLSADPYLASLKPEYRPCLLSVCDSKKVIERVFYPDNNKE